MPLKPRWAVSEQALYVKNEWRCWPVREGYTLSDSLREHPASLTSVLFDDCCRKKSGHLDVVLNRLAVTEQRQRLKSLPAAGRIYRWYCWWWRQA